MDTLVCQNLIKKIFTLKDIIQEGIDYELSKDSHKLFNYISDSLLTKYKYFTKLFKHYNEINGIKETYQQQELEDIDFFLELVIQSKQGKIMEEYLHKIT